MRTKLFCQIFFVMAGFGGVLSVPAQAQTNDSPYASQPFVMDGAISHVDKDRDRVIFDGDDGHSYTLDTATAEITLPNGSRAGMTSDLAEGMRLHVVGERLSSGIAEVDTLKVLPARPLVTVPEAEIQLRGTVETIDTRRGAFVVRVSNHTRTIYLADDTDLTGLALADPNRFPVKLGDRVTVAGRLQPDGGVLAGAVSLSKTIALPMAPSAGRVLFGRIVSVSNRYTSRDIKIRQSDDREVKVKVKRGLSVRRDGRGISVHDLHGGDDVRVIGNFDGDDFKATRIDVLHRDDDANTSIPTRHGL